MPTASPRSWSRAAHRYGGADFRVGAETCNETQNGVTNVTTAAYDSCATSVLTGSITLDTTGGGLDQHCRYAVVLTKR